MKERDLCSIFRKSCAKDGYQYVNIPDSMSTEDLMFDGILNFRGAFVAIEFKRLTKYSAINPKILRDTQVRGLEISHATGGLSLVGVFIWTPNKINELIVFEWSEFKRLTNDLTTSIPRDTALLRTKSKCKKRQFDLTDFYSFVELNLF